MNTTAEKNLANARFAAQWPWAVVDNDGIVVNRFKREADAKDWGKGFYEVAHMPTPQVSDIF